MRALLLLTLSLATLAFADKPGRPRGTPTSQVAVLDVFPGGGRILAHRSLVDRLLVLEAPSGKRVAELAVSSTGAVVLGPDSVLFASGALRRWTPSTGAVAVVTPDLGSISSLAVAQGKVAVLAGTELWLFDAESWKPAAGSPFEVPYGTSGVTWSPDGRRLITVNPTETVRVLDATTGGLLAELKQAKGPGGILFAEFLSADRVVIANDQIGLWKVAPPERIALFPAARYGLSVYSGALERNRQLLAAGDLNSVSVWSLATRTRLALTELPRGDVRGIRFLGGTQLVFADSSTFYVWDFATQKLVAQWSLP